MHRTRKTRSRRRKTRKGGSGLWNSNNNDNLHNKRSKRIQHFQSFHATVNPERVRIQDVIPGQVYFFKRGPNFIVGTVVSVNKNTIQLKNAYTFSGNHDEGGRFQANRIGMEDYYYRPGIDQIFRTNFTSSLPDDPDRVIREFLGSAPKKDPNV